jgi:hypothetical protein
MVDATVTVLQWTRRTATLYVLTHVLLRYNAQLAAVCTQQGMHTSWYIVDHKSHLTAPQAGMHTRCVAHGGHS